MSRDSSTHTPPRKSARAPLRARERCHDRPQRWGRALCNVGLRELVKQGSLAGPDVFASGYHLRPRLAEEAFLTHPDLAGLLGGVTTIDALRRIARVNHSHGVDWIKVMATERAGTPETDPRQQIYTETELRAIVEEAKGLNLSVQAHAHGDDGGSPPSKPASAASSTAPICRTTRCG